MVLDTVMSFGQSLSLAEARVVLEPLIVFVIAMAIYAIFVYKFYRFIARKNVFTLSKGSQASTARKILHGLEYLFLFPIISFLWFFIISALLAMLSEVLAIENIFLASVAMLATIRLTAYYNEDLSRDIAKLIPFALLAVFLLDLSGLSFSVVFDVINQIPPVIDTLVYYFLFIVVLEFILRILFGRHKTPKKKHEKQSEEENI